jgi:hypothetical protein
LQRECAGQHRTVRWRRNPINTNTNRAAADAKKAPPVLQDDGGAKKEKTACMRYPPLILKTSRLYRFSSRGFPSNDELRWLLRQGISDAALWPISGATVRLDGSTFALDPDGERALIFRAEDCGEVIDLIAWQPRTDKLASWRGIAFCLGDVDDIFNSATYFAGGALRVHETPLQWLRAERDGIMILRPDLAHAYLADRRIVCPDARFAHEVEA